MFERELAGIARRQHGLVLVDQALATGMTRRMVDRRVERGELVRVARRLVRVASMPVTFEQRALAPCLLAGQGAMASHLTAAVLHGMSGVRAARIEITVPRGRRHESDLAAVHASLRPPRILRVDGIPVTDPHRTLADIANRLNAAALAEAVDDAFIRGLSTRTRVERALEHARAGHAELRAALEVWTPGPMPGSIPEMRLARMLVAAGFPVPERQIEVFDARGTLIGRGDLGYRDRRVIVEYFGADGHGPRTVDWDFGREYAMRAAGWTYLEANKATFGRNRRAFLAALTAAYRQAA